jgi:E3 ubiquitin-protein ligase TRIP12
METLLRVLESSDQKVVEQGCLCVSRIVESFKYQSDKLEELVSPELLRAILRLLLPGTTNLIGSDIHTQFLRVLAITARASPSLSVELFKMNVVDTLYQILTGVSPPSGDADDVATKIDSVVIMQALIHRPRNQIFETLNVICELLPGLPARKQFDVDDVSGSFMSPSDLDYLSVRPNESNSKRLELLEGCKEELRRFAVILLPTLTDAYSSTVNLSVRQKVLTAQLKMLSNLDTSILEDALRTVPYASFLASILSQQDNTGLVMFALQASELLLERLESIYRYQFHREGVIAEISRLANRPLKKPPVEKTKTLKTVVDVEPIGSSSQETSSQGDIIAEHEIDEPHDDSSDGSPVENDDDDDESHSDDSSDMSDDHFTLNPEFNTDDLITQAAKHFSKQNGGTPSKESSEKASTVLEDLKSLAQDIKSCYVDHSSSLDGRHLFTRLASYFDGDALESITSYELLTSGIVEVLLDIFSATKDQPGSEARAAFLEAFMGGGTQIKQKTATSASPTTSFSILVHKLQDLLSRAEHFEVITVHHNSFDSNRSSAASMLAKQLKVRLVADEESGIPRSYRNIMVSIHAIATFKALDEYLRPRISIAERPRTSRSRDGMSSALAAYTAALANRGDGPGRGSPGAPPLPGAFDTTNRVPRRSTKRTTGSSTTAQAGSSSTSEKPSSSRRSARKSGQSDAPPPPPPPPAPPRDSDDMLDTLECADEAQLTDESEGREEGADIVDDFEEDMDEDTPDPGAVNMEVAAGGRVTARKEDGTRVATPQQNNTPHRPPQTTNERFTTQHLLEAARQFGAPSGRSPLSYAAAIQSVPQDWHIEFSVNDQPISHDTTIYRAVHFNQTAGADVSVRNIWGGTHEIKIKKAPGPPPAEPSSLTPPPEASKNASNLPQSLDKNPTTSGILRLLSILHELNTNLDDVLSENKDTIKLNREPLSQFVNTKLTAKLNRQLEEPLIVASNCLPSWSEDLARLYPFLFPFETRHLFLQSTSFGYSRSMTRWQNAQAGNESSHRHRDERPFLGRLQRQKVRIARTKILESAIKVMELYGSSPSILEVEYFEEVGTGLGPTLEFYSTVSKEFSKKKLKLWREDESNDKDEFAFGKRGLFPAPMSEEMSQSDNGKRVLNLFKILGKFVARSMLDSRIIDISFNPTFFRIGSGASSVKPSLGSLQSVDADLARALKMVKKFATAKQAIEADPSIAPEDKPAAIENIEIDNATIDALGLDFTLPGYPHIELQADGQNMPVTMDNVGLYVDKVLDFTLGTGVQKQAEAFASGFSQVFPFSALRAFTPDELVMLFGRTEEDWSLETLMDSIKADHGYNLDSKSVRNLLQTMSELNAAQRRDFLQFVTGSPKLPIGGFKALTPMFTVVCKPSEPPFTSDDYLPSVMTCVNYLKMPDYSTVEILQEKLNIAIREGQGAFHLS